jgi:hypothetical protein
MTMGTFQEDAPTYRDRVHQDRPGLGAGRLFDQRQHHVDKQQRHGQHCKYSDDDRVPEQLSRL